MKGYLYTVMQVLLTLCGIWSLDFFRSVVPPFCVSSSLNNIHALSLEYLAAFYPICLIAVTYTCIKLHNNNFRPMVWLWKPFHRHVVNIRRRCMWDSMHLPHFCFSLIPKFSLYHSHCCTLLIFTISMVRKSVFYISYDQTVDCHGQERFIFATLAICVLTIFIISPVLLLLLYPT